MSRFSVSLSSFSDFLTFKSHSVLFIFFEPNLSRVLHDMFETVDFISQSYVVFLSLSHLF